MTRLFPIAALTLALGALAALPAAAQPYPIDCAIFLCLAGGFPASPECAAAEAVFIARIESFQPPLQLWNCPMAARFRRAPPGPAPVTLARLESALSPRAIEGPYRPLAAPSRPIPVSTDLTTADFAFIRSIHVWWTVNRTRRGPDGCASRGVVLEEGFYDAGNNWHWGAAATPVPAYLPQPDSDGCGWWNDVGADWTDLFGTPAHLLKPLPGG